MITIKYKYCDGFTYDAMLHFYNQQKAEMRCLLSKTLLDHGFFSNKKETNGKCKENEVPNFSWSGQRKTPSYLNKLVFPEEFLTCLRTIAMGEDEIYKVTSLLQEVHSYFCFITTLCFKKSNKL